MKKKQERLSSIEKIVVMLAASLPIATFAFTFWDAKDASPGVEI